MATDSSANSDSAGLPRRTVLQLAAYATGAIGLIGYTSPEPAFAESCAPAYEAPPTTPGAHPSQKLEVWGHPFTTRTTPTRHWGGCYNEYYPTPGPHRGIDYGRANGVGVHAVAAGTVVFAGSKPGNASWSWAGNYVLIRHQSGHHSLYAHMSQLSVQTGAELAVHTKVGEVGQTGGNWGSHLHLEIWTDSDRISNTNPYRLIHDAPLVGEPFGDDMPTYISHNYHADQPVTSSYSVPDLDSSGTAAVAIGGVVSAVASLEFSDLAVGEVVQARFVRVDQDGSNLASLGVVEIIGTASATYGQVAAVIDLGTNKRLRLQIMGPTTATLKNISARVLKW